MRPGEKQTETGESLSIGFKEFISTAPPRRDWLIKYLLPAKSIVYISGQEKKAMKTFFAMCLSMIVATGRTVGFLKPGNFSGNVLYVLEEGEDGETRERMAAIAKGVGLDPSDERFRFLFHKRVKLDDADWRRKLVKEVRKHECKLVVFDTITYMMEGEENNATDVNIVIDTLQAIRKEGASVLCLFHLKKSSEEGGDPDSQIRGSGVFPQARDTHLALRRFDRKKAVIDLSVLHRGGSDRDFGVMWDLTKHTLQDEDGDDFEVLDKAVPNVFEVSGEKFAKKYVRALTAEETYTTKDLAELWEMPIPAASVVAKALEDEGYLDREKGLFSLVEDDYA